MGLKGKIKDDHIPLNKAELLVPGVPNLVAVTISGLEQAIQAVDLPDRTKRSGGQTEPVEFEIEVPMHHKTEVAGMDIWFQMGQDPVTPGYLRAGTLRFNSISGQNKKSYTLIGLWCSGRNTPDADMANEGELAMVTYVLNADDILPIGI